MKNTLKVLGMIAIITAIIFSFAACGDSGGGGTDFTNIEIPDPSIGTPDTSWYNGTNTAFTINTGDQLAGLAQLVNDGTNDFSGKTITLGANINLAAYGYGAAGWNSGNGWIPISYFNGIFNGNNKTISNLYINDDNYGYAGLFGYIWGGTVKNLNLVIDSHGVNGGDYTGGIVGYIEHGTIEKCSVTGGPVSGWFDIGGVVGSSYGIVNECYAAVAVSGTDECVGGIAGYIDYIINNCYSTGSVSGTSNYVGGISGEFGGSMTNCYATGAISSPGNCVGGIVGYIYSGGSITACVALNSTISGGSNVGRIIGLGGTLANNYALSTISDYGNTGAGNLDGADVSAANAKKAVTYSSIGWDMTTVWKIAENSGYPSLR